MNDLEIINKFKKNNFQSLDLFSNKILLNNYIIDLPLGLDKQKINEINIRIIAYALASFFKQKSNLQIVIGHDNGINSAFYTKVIAKVLNFYGLTSILFELNATQPLSLLSYSIKKLQLGGGIYVGLDNLSKINSGVKILNNYGEFINKLDVIQINKMLTKNLFKEIKLSNKKFKLIKKEIINEYIKEVLNILLRKNDTKLLTFAFFSNEFTNTSLIQSLIAKMNINYLVYKKSSCILKQIYNKTKLKLNLFISCKKYASLIANINPSFSMVKFVLKHNYKYVKLDPQALAAIYLEYKLTQLKMQNKNISGIIITSSNSKEILYITKKFGLKLNIVKNNFSNITQVINQSKENVIFAFANSGGFIVNSKISFVPDALQMIVSVVEMVNYYKTQSINLLDLITRIKNLI